MKITTVNDYINNVHKKFPEINKQDIKIILTYCWKMIYLYNSQGNDTMIRDRDILFFIGKLRTDSLSNFNWYVRKLSRKIRFMFMRNKETWDGYYYFALNNLGYKNYLSQSRKKYKTFKYVKLYKLLDECKVKNWDKQFIFRVKDDTGVRFTKWYDELKTKDAEFIMERDPMNIYDLIDINKKCKYLS